VTITLAARAPLPRVTAWLLPTGVPVSPAPRMTRLPAALPSRAAGIVAVTVKVR
jgi:hypothetical protein